MMEKTDGFNRFSEENSSKNIPQLKDISESKDKIPKESFSISIPNEKDEKDDVIIGSFEQAPDFLQDNEYIKKGYRINCNNIPKVLKSLFVLHNETINIWSHLLGCIMSICFIIYTATLVVSNPTPNQLANYKKMISEFKDTTTPWIDSFDSLEKELENEEAIKILKTIKESTLNFLNEVNEKTGFKDKFDDYIDNMKILLDKAKSKFSELKKLEIFNNISSAWDTVQTKLIKLVDVYGMSIGEKQKKSYDGDSEERLSIWPLFVMLASSIFCLGCSATYHWFMPLSKETNKILSRLDYAGITILIAGSCYPPYYYFYYCEKSKTYN